MESDNISQGNQWCKPDVNPHIRLESSKGSLSGIWRMKTLFILLIPALKYKFVYSLKSCPRILAWEIFAWLASREVRTCIVYNVYWKKQSTSDQNIFIFGRKTQQKICCNNKNKVPEFLTTDQSKEIVKTWVKLKYVEEHSPPFPGRGTGRSSCKTKVLLVTLPLKYA